MSDLPTIKDIKSAKNWLGRLEQYHCAKIEQNTSAFEKARHSKSHALCQTARRVLEAYAKGRIK